ncbi:MAG TPA: hypothetical protein VGM38_02615, partial [Pseudolysinimonas sp.]
MASKTEKSAYKYNKSRRLTMIPEDIKKLISDTPQKKRDTPEPETFEESVKPPTLTIYTFEVEKPEPDSPLVEWTYESPPMTEANWKRVSQDIQNILAYTQQLAYVHCYHPQDIRLLFEAAAKHFLWTTNIPFDNKDLELTSVLNERLKRPKIPQLTEPHWVLKEWEEIMCFMLCGQHLVLPITIGQFENPPIANRPKGQDRRNPPETPTRQHSAQEVSTETLTGILPEDDNAEHTSQLGQTGNEEEDDNFTPTEQRGATTGGGDDDGDNSSSSSDDSGTDSSAPSYKGNTKKVKKKKRTTRGKTPEQQQWELTTGIVMPETSSKLSKRMKGIKIDAPENLNSGDK